MSIHSDAYLRSLYHHLGVKNKDEITNDHSMKIIKFIKNSPNQDAIEEILLSLPDFLKFAEAQLVQMKDISNKIIESGDKDISQLTAIITSYNELLKNPALDTDEKKQIINLLFNYQKMLEEKMKENDRLKRLIYAGAFTLAAISLSIVANWVNTAIGSKVDPDSLKEAAQKILEKS